MIFYLLQIFLSLIAYHHFRNNYIRYFAVITTIYFLVYYRDGSYDVALSLYFILIFIGIGIPERLRLSEIAIGVHILLYTIIGVVFQDAFATMAVLITRYAYILIFIGLSCMRKNIYKADASDYRYAVRLGLLTEFVIIILVWMQHGIGARIVTNHQPIGAGIVIGLSIIIGWCYLTKQFSASETIVYSVISVIITILSGTRGYMLIMAFPMLIVMLVYLLDVPNKGEKMFLRVGVCCIVVAFAIVWLLIFDHGETLVSVLRLEDSLGYRENENVFVKEIMIRAPWHNKWFGFGFSGDASHIDGFLEAVQVASWNRSFMYRRLLKGSMFHNYWYTVLFKQGIIGIIFIIGFYAMAFIRIGSLKNTWWIKSLLIMILIGNALSFTFRITATCSIFEMLLIAYIIKVLEVENTTNENTLVVSEEKINGK